MGRIIKKISVLIISLFVCVNIFSPFNKAFAYDTHSDSGVAFYDSNDNMVLIYEIYNETTYEDEELSPSYYDDPLFEDGIDGLHVKYNSSNDTFTIYFTNDVELSGLRLLCGSNLVIDLSQHNFKMNFDLKNVYEGRFKSARSIPIESVEPVKTSFNNLFNTNLQSNTFGETLNLRAGIEVYGSLFFVGGNNFQFDFGLDPNSFFHTALLPFDIGMGACIYCTNLYIGDDNVGPTIKINEIRDEQFIDMNGLFLTAPINADGSECFIKNSVIEINSYVAGMSVGGDFNATNSIIDIYRKPMAAPAYIGFEIMNYPGNEGKAHFNNCDISIVEGRGSSIKTIEGFTQLNNISGSYGLSIEYQSEFNNCDVNIDMSSSDGYSIIDYMSSGNRESYSSFEFNDSYVTLLGPIELTYGLIKFAGDSNFYVTSHELDTVSAIDDTQDSLILIELSDEGTGLFETWNYDKSWEKGFSLAGESFLSAKGSYTTWDDTVDFEESESENYSWAAFQKDCVASIKDSTEPSTYKTFTMFDSMPGIILNPDNPFVGWFYKDKNGKERSFLNYIREDCVVYSKFKKDPIDPTGFDYYDLVEPTDTSSGCMPYYVDVENETYYAYSPEGAIWIGDQDAFELWTDDVRGGCILSLNDPNAIYYPLTISPSQIITVPVKDTYTFTSDAVVDKFALVTINGNRIENNDYTLSSGPSTVINFNDDFFDDFNSGEYTINIISKDGHASNKFTIKKNSNPDHPSRPSYIIPSTGIR